MGNAKANDTRLVARHNSTKFWSNIGIDQYFQVNYEIYIVDYNILNWILEPGFFPRSHLPLHVFIAPLYKVTNFAGVF